MVAEIAQVIDYLLDFGSVEVLVLCGRHDYVHGDERARAANAGAVRGAVRVATKVGLCVRLWLWLAPEGGIGDEQACENMRKWCIP